MTAVLSTSPDIMEMTAAMIKMMTRRSISFPYWKPSLKNTRDFLIRAQEPLSHLRATMEFLDTGQMNLIRTPIPIDLDEILTQAKEEEKT